MQDMRAEPSALADSLPSMTDEELYQSMSDLEKRSEALSQAGQDTREVLAQIAQVETEIETRSPGQKLAPYKNWKRRVI